MPEDVDVDVEGRRTGGREGQGGASYHFFFFFNEATASAPGVAGAGATGCTASRTFFGFLASLLPCLPLVMWDPFRGNESIVTDWPGPVCAQAPGSNQVTLERAV